MELISKENVQKILDVAYDIATNGIEVKGVSIFDSAQKLAEDYQQDYPDDLERQINSFINWQCFNAGTCGLVTSFGGFTTMIITLPTDITTVLAIQLRMIATIAILCGYNVKNDKVKMLIKCCLIKEKMVDVIKETGTKISQKLGVKLIQKIPTKLIKKINKTIGAKVITKFGQKGLVNLGKLVPILGAAVGATIDVASTKTVGVFTKKTLMSKKIKENFIETTIVK